MGDGNKDDKFSVMDGYYPSECKSIIIHNGYVQIHIQSEMLDMNMDIHGCP